MQKGGEKIAVYLLPDGISKMDIPFVLIGFSDDLARPPVELRQANVVNLLEVFAISSDILPGTQMGAYQV